MFAHSGQFRSQSPKSGRLRVEFGRIRAGTGRFRLISCQNCPTFSTRRPCSVGWARNRPISIEIDLWPKLCIISGMGWHPTHPLWLKHLRASALPTRRAKRARRRALRSPRDPLARADDPSHCVVGIRERARRAGCRGRHQRRLAAGCPGATQKPTIGLGPRSGGRGGGHRFGAFNEGWVARWGGMHGRGAIRTRMVWSRRQGGDSTRSLCAPASVAIPPALKSAMCRQRWSFRMRFK